MLTALAVSVLPACSGPTTPEGVIPPSAAGAVSSLSVPRDAFRSEFEAILATTDHSYAFKAEKGVDIAELRTRFGPDVDRADTSEAFHAVLVRLFSALHNSHTGMVLPAWAFLEAGVGTELVGERLLLTGEIADGVLRDHGIARGWEITTVDDVPFPAWLAQRGTLISASTLQYQRVAASRLTTRRFWFEPAARRFTFRSPAGEAITLELPLDRRREPAAPLPLASSRTIEGLGYVAVESLTGNVVPNSRQSWPR